MLMVLGRKITGLRYKGRSRSGDGEVAIGRSLLQFEGSRDRVNYFKGATRLRHVCVFGFKGKRLWDER